MDVEADAQKVFDTVAGGGVALIYLDVAYALIAGSADAVRRIYQAKGREFGKPMGLVGGLTAHDALNVLDTPRRDMVRAVTVTHNLPLSVVAPARMDHPFLQKMDPFVLGRCTANGTMNLLLNAGLLRDRLGELSWHAGIPMVGTSANLSLAGSNYGVEDVEPQILAACDVVIDHGVSKYRNTEGLSSTIVDFAGLKLIRRGVCFERIAAVLSDDFGVALQ